MIKLSNWPETLCSNCAAERPHFLAFLLFCYQPWNCMCGMIRRKCLLKCEGCAALGVQYLCSSGLPSSTTTTTTILTHPHPPPSRRRQASQQPTAIRHCCACHHGSNSQSFLPLSISLFPSLSLSGTSFSVRTLTLCTLTYTFSCVMWEGCPWAFACPAGEQSTCEQNSNAVTVKRCRALAYSSLWTRPLAA